jgi:biopolymer transport protein ExbD
MSVGVNYLIKGSFENHLSVREGSKRKFKRTVMVTLSLTSMVDVFSMLVVFLLQTFSSTPEILIPKDVILPTAKSHGEVKEAPVLSISKGGIYLDQIEVGDIKKVISKPELLIARLKEVKSKFATNNPGLPYPGEINFQADSQVPSTLISQIMSHLNGQNYHSIHLAVISGGK